MPAQAAGALAPEAPLQPAPAWSAAERAGFRLAFCAFVAILAPYPLSGMWGLESVDDLASRFWHPLAAWAGEHVLRAPLSEAMTGSGDRAWDWAMLVANLAVATAAALAWSLLDRRRQSYAALARWLHVFLRYALAGAMISYGLAKVLQTQFPPISYAVLSSTYGGSSPMRLLWTLMSFSPGYNFFTGGLECLGGVLLFFRHTATLGALVSAGAMANVLALNLCYDVPVKSYSAILLAQALWLLAADARRLLDALVRNRLVEPVDLRPPVRSPRALLWWRIAKALAIALLMIPMVRSTWAYRQQIGNGHEGALGGWYRVEQFVAQPRAGAAWANAEFTSIDFWVLRADGVRDRYELGKYDAAAKTLTLSNRYMPAPMRQSWKLSAEPRPDGTLALKGTLLGETFEATLRKLPPPGFPLLQRGFHWISEMPFNR